MQVFKDLVRYATLAPSSHNTQCWKFKIRPDGIKILPDFDRRCPVVDPDDHHLFVSLGCALENLVVAANEHEFATQVDAGSSETGIDIKLYPSDIASGRKSPENSQLFDAIEIRQCNRGIYDGKKLSPSDLQALEAAGKGDGVKLILLTEDADKEKINEFVSRANSIQLKDKRFKEELKSWVRFNDREALRSGDGLSGKCMGHPSVPRWLGGLILEYAVSDSKENQKITEWIDSSAGVAVVVSEKDDPMHWIEAGRVYERFALTATSLGIHNAHLNQPVEIKSIRKEFSQYLGLAEGSRPDLVLRFGRGNGMPKSFRRPLESVIQYQ